MNTKHTAGPWEVRAIDESIGCVDAADGSAVAQAQPRGTLRDPKNDERRANARLIAASPCLLDALLQWQHAERESDEAEIANARFARDTAIAKATREDAP